MLMKVVDANVLSGDEKKYDETIRKYFIRYTGKADTVIILYLLIWFNFNLSMCK